MWGSITGEVSSKSRDDALAKVRRDRTHSHIRAWEENEKTKVYNKYFRKVAKITAWENTEKAASQAKLKKAEERLERQRAAYVEKMKNEMAGVHRAAEEKKAIAESMRGEAVLLIEEKAARFRAAGHIPKKFLCFDT